MTEQDFRQPQFQNQQPEDFEFRADGAIVRKDRWERAVHSMRHLVGIGSREFEIEDIVEAVRKLALDQEGWWSIKEDVPLSKEGISVSIRLIDGSILRGANVKRHGINNEFLATWQGANVTDRVESWKE